MRSLMLAVVGLALAAALAHAATPEARWRVGSPNGELVFTLRLSPDGERGGSLSYAVERLSGGARTPVLRPSPLGLRRSDQAFERGLRFLSVGPLATVDESYTLPHGKRRSVRVQARQQTFTFTNASAARLEVTVRVSDDGVAFRYGFPEKSEEVRTLGDESTGFNLPPGTTAWMMPQEPPGRYEPAYEDYFGEVPSGTTAPTPSGWSFPALFKIDGGRHWLLISEAGVDASHCGSRLAAAAPDGLYRVRLPEAGEGMRVGAVEPSSTLPWALPWRVLIVGGSLARVVESTLVNDVSAPSVVEDTSWIRPGRASWSWWSDDDSPKNERALKDFVDLAADMGWEYSLVDANWNTMEPGALERVIAHAKQKGVGILLWYNSGGPHNDVTEQPRDRMHTREVRRAEMARLREWGVKGVKVDFWHSDKQDRIQQYLDVLRDAADHRLLVNFHGCTLPRGWSRTYPCLVAMEGVMGAEQYKFKANYPEKAAWHNTVLAFTRNVVGPMDFTPVTFTDLKYPRLTTDAHELALSVVFESGIQHFADSVVAYRSLPEPARAFLKAVPTAWDETRLVSGEPGRRAVFARRSGQSWFVGGINGQTAAESLELDLGFLPAGAYNLTLITDGKEARQTLTGSNRRVKAGDRILVALLPRGGFVARIERER